MLRPWEGTMTLLGRASVLACLFCLCGSAQTTGAKEQEWMAAIVRADQFQRQGNYSEAEAVLLSAERVAEQFGPSDPRLAATLNNLGSVYQDLGKFLDAERSYERSIVQWEKLYGQGHPALIRPLTNLASLYAETRQHRKAVALRGRFLEIRAEELSPGDPDVPKFLNNFAWLYYIQGQTAEARPLFEEALAIRESRFGPEHPELALALSNLAMVAMNAGEYAEANASLERAMRILQRSSRPDPATEAKVLLNLATLYSLQHRSAEAEPFLKRALEIANTAEPARLLAGQIASHYAVLLKQLNRKAEAKQMAKRAKTLQEEQTENDYTHYTVDISELVASPIAAHGPR